jgi:hypothetical protein
VRFHAACCIDHITPKIVEEFTLANDTGYRRTLFGENQRFDSRQTGCGFLASSPVGLGLLTKAVVNWLSETLGYGL